jgi:hypothetical protein
MNYHRVRYGDKPITMHPLETEPNNERQVNYF